MNDSIKQRVLRIVLEGGFIWYDVVVPEDFNLKDFMVAAEEKDGVFFENESLALFVPWHQLKSMFTFRVTQEVKLNVVNFPPGASTCEPPKAS